MSSDDEMDVDFYDVSDTTSGGQSADDEYIDDIIQGIDLIGIQQYLLAQKQEPQIPNFFRTGPQYQTHNKYMPAWMNPSQAFAGTGYPLRHPALRDDDLWQVQGNGLLPGSEYAK